MAPRFKGLDRLGSCHVSSGCLVEDPEARLVALCDVNRIGSRKPGRGPRLYTDADDDVRERARCSTFVEICTRPESHRALVELAARHGRSRPLPEAGRALCVPTWWR